MITRNDLIKLFAEKGIEVTRIAVLHWSFWELEFGRARLVAEIKGGGHAYCIETMGMINRRLKEGKKFFIELTTGTDYDFGTR